MCILGGVIVYLVHRQRRMQQPYNHFPNPHYDSKTGATRIGGRLEDDDHEHQEVPTNNADDEPLVTA